MMRFPPRLRAIGAVALAVAAGGIVYVFPPAETWWYPRCPCLWLTGLRCPGCGTLRALHAALHGNWADAVRLNALTVCLIPLLALYGAVQIRPAAKIRVPGAVWAALAVLSVLFGIARNVMSL